MTSPDAPRIVTSAGVDFSYLCQGDGRAVLLFLHGIGSGARSWTGQISSLGQAYRAVAWDAPGYGRSTALAEPEPDASDYARRLRIFVDALGLDRAHLVGHSLGAIMAARFAVEYPERVRTLTLVSPSTGHAHLTDEDRARLRNQRIRDLRELGPAGLARLRGPRLVSGNADADIRQHVVDTMARIRPDGYAQAVHLLSVSDTAGDVGKLKADLPLQFIAGHEDCVTPLQGTLGIASRRPSAQIHALPACGHALYLERPDEFNALLRRFASCEP